MKKATVHKGPKGGVEYRLWSETGETFFLVGKYKARPYMSTEELEKTSAMEHEARERKLEKARAEQNWREFRRGG